MARVMWSAGAGAMGLALGAGLAGGLAGCAGPSSRQAALERALASAEPPADFMLGVTVLREPAETASRAESYRRLPVGVRPARYVVEADRVLRVAVGSGASEETFPPRTRQLTGAQTAALWEALRTSPLASGDAVDAAGPAIDPRSLRDRTVYVVTYSAEGVRRRVVVEEGDETGELAAARGLVERLGALGWVAGAQDATGGATP